MKRACLVLFATLLTLAATAACAPTAPASPTASAKRTQVNVQLGWIKNTEFAGLFAADQKGYYADEGIDVNFISGGAGIDPLNIVRSNSDYIGVVASSGTLINAVSKGAPFVALGAFYQKHPNGFLLLKDSPINSYKDFEGRKIGVQPEGEYYLDVLAAIYGLDKSKIQIVRLGADPSPLLTGQVDAYMAWIVNQPYLAQKAGKQWRFLLLADTPGLQFYAQVPFVTKEFLAKNPDLIQRWMRASLKGWSYVLDHPDEVADLVIKNYLPGGDVEAEKWLLKQANVITVSDDTQKNGLGWMDPKKWDEGIQTLLKYKQIDSAPKVDDVMTNQFVEKAVIKR
jgi:ABC-type nitrate/sulfonate/bicarbonate transport system substrate-binding protein